MIAALFCLGFSGILVYAAWRDLAEMLIPNWCSIAIALLFFPAAAAAGFTMEQVGWHLAFGALVLLVCAGLFFIGVFGGGDAKVIAACSLWAGFAGSAAFVMWMALAGGLLSLALIILRRMKVQSEQPWAKRLLSPTEGAPYVVAIAIGALLAAPASPLLSAGLAAAA
jgi:prepilin peptidase CpaA